MGNGKQNIFKELFLQNKPAEMLVFLKKGKDPKYATQVSKAVDCTYSHTIKVLDIFEKLGIVEFTKKGRIKLIKLTSYGEDIAHDLEGLIRKFERASQEKRKKKEEPKK